MAPMPVVRVGFRYGNRVELVSKLTIDLPEPSTDSGVSLEQAMLQRRSVREYTNETLDTTVLGQLLWRKRKLDWASSSLPKI